MSELSVQLLIVSVTLIVIVTLVRPNSIRAKFLKWFEFQVEKKPEKRDKNDKA